MKVSTIITLIASTLASKVVAECWAEDLGYPCCQQTTKVVLTEDVGDWGYEDGSFCGIVYDEPVEPSDEQPVEQPIEQPVEQPVEPPSGDAPNPFEGMPFDEENNPFANGGSSSSGNFTVTPIANTAVSEYMSKLSVVDNCPPTVSALQDDVIYPKAEKVTYYSETTQSDRKMNVILPVGYTETKRYPVLYFLHGIMGDEDSMILLGHDTISIPTNLAKNGMAKEMIIVLPSQYAPEPGHEIPPQISQEYFEGYDNFINDLVGSIMPYMEAHYSIATGRENTAIAGFSMGGRNSLYIGYKRSDLFGYVGAFSPAPGVVPGDDFSGHHPGLFKLESEFRAEIQPISTVLSTGTKDSVVGTFPRSYHEILTKNNQDHIYIETPDADHDARALAAGYYNFIQTAFGALAN